MTDIETAQALLFFAELPDQHEQLSVQPYVSLDSFTNFPKLPIEVGTQRAFFFLLVTT